MIAPQNSPTKRTFMRVNDRLINLAYVTDVVSRKDPNRGPVVEIHYVGDLQAMTLDGVDANECWRLMTSPAFRDQFIVLDVLPDNPPGATWNSRGFPTEALR